MLGPHAVDESVKTATQIRGRCGNGVPAIGEALLQRRDLGTRGIITGGSTGKPFSRTRGTRGVDRASAGRIGAVDCILDGAMDRILIGFTEQTSDVFAILGRRPCNPVCLSILDALPGPHRSGTLQLEAIMLH